MLAWLPLAQMTALSRRHATQSLRDLLRRLKDTRHECEASVLSSGLLQASSGAEAKTQVRLIALGQLARCTVLQQKSC